MNASRQTGMAVIGALIVVAAASVAAGAIMERQALLADTLAGERDRIQAKWLLRGGLDWARIILLNDGRNNAVTLKDAIWAQPIAGLEIKAPGDTRSAHFAGIIEDEQGKYNLQRLAKGGAVQATEFAALNTLLAGLGLPAGLASAISDRVARAQAGPAGTASAPGLRNLRDLLGTPGVSVATIAILSEYLTVLPPDTALNLNTASAEVLSAALPRLDLARARSLMEERDRGHWFTSRGDFLNRLDDPEIAREAALTVRSEWFKVTGEIRLEHASVSLQALLHRQGDALPIVRWIED